MLLNKEKEFDGRESCLGDLDPWTVQVLLQTTIELGQPTIFQVGNTLLLILNITPGSKFVGSHRVLSCEGSANGERGERGFWIGRCPKGVRIRLGAGNQGPRRRTKKRKEKKEGEGVGFEERENGQMNGLVRGDFPEIPGGQVRGFPFFLTRFTLVYVILGKIIGRGSTWYFGWVGVLLVLCTVVTNTQLVPGTYCSNSDELAI